MMNSYTIKNLNDIRELLQALTAEQYSSRIEALSDGSIGQHIRHIIEFYKCLFAGLETGNVNYDLRERDLKLESDLSFAIKTVNEISNYLLQLNEDRSLILIANFCTDVNNIEKLSTTLYRELAYNLEHSIHHQALIKVALLEMKLEKSIRSNFGYAPSTIRFNENNSNVYSNIHSN